MALKDGMTSPALQQRLLRISKLPKKSIDIFTEGETLAAAFGQSISEITQQTVADRLALGEHFLQVANDIKRSRSRSRDWRTLIGRYYYAMYHSMRAVSFYYHGGDDYQDHSALSTKIPDDFPNRVIRANELKDSRLRRNEADYDPYPMTSPQFRSTALAMGPIANNFVSECRGYLQLKGCKYI